MSSSSDEVSQVSCSKEVIYFVVDTISAKAFGGKDGRHRYFFSFPTICEPHYKHEFQIINFLLVSSINV